jgi:HD-GYP domain-containing protein (c-di-GMP phosphodiesterase class II)
MDGSGYPLGLNGHDIRLEARILGVADTVEAMLRPRSYRPALGMDKALQRIASNKDILYDPDVVEACLAVLLDRGFKFQSPHSRRLETSGQGQDLNGDFASA